MSLCRISFVFASLLLTGCYTFTSADSIEGPRTDDRDATHQPDLSDNPDQSMDMPQDDQGAGGDADMDPPVPDNTRWVLHGPPDHLTSAVPTPFIHMEFQSGEALAYLLQSGDSAGMVTYQFPSVQMMEPLVPHVIAVARPGVSVQIDCVSEEVVVRDQGPSISAGFQGLTQECENLEVGDVVAAIDDNLSTLYLSARERVFRIATMPGPMGGEIQVSEEISGIHRGVHWYFGAQATIYVLDNIGGGGGEGDTVRAFAEGRLHDVLHLAEGIASRQDYVGRIFEGELEVLTQDGASRISLGAANIARMAWVEGAFPAKYAVVSSTGSGELVVDLISAQENTARRFQRSLSDFESPATSVPEGEWVGMGAIATLDGDWIKVFAAVIIGDSVICVEIHIPADE